MELPQTVNGNHYVILFVDYLTKWVESIPSDNQTSETIVRLLIDHVICCHGVTQAMISDRGPNLLSTLVQNVCEMAGMQKLNTTAYHPQAEGLVENFNRTLQASLPNMLWSLVWTGMNTSIICSSYIELNPESTGESLFFLLYGRDARIPCEATLSTIFTAYQVNIH